MSSANNNQLPESMPWSKYFWEQCNNHKLVVQVCRDCQELIMYPKKYCPKCLSDNLDWMEASGKGTIYSHTTVYKNPPSAFLDSTPFTIVIIELAEGVKMMSNLIDGEGEAACGDEVEVVFKKGPNGSMLPFFKRL